ncbi:MAG: nucleoside monophosphate kinase [Clostridia bacterium]|nr:nucleoside monophosphate kinase [Clostridia bacterium]
MNIVLLGIQGAGKGTLVSYLQQKLNFNLISAGQLCRDEILAGSDLGKKLKERIDNGLLADFDTIFALVKDKLKHADNSITIFDGFPRTVEQAEALEQIAKVDLVIYLKLDKAVAVDRILNRLTCERCGHVTAKSAVTSNICRCGGKLTQRADDTLESIENRFEVFETETLPLINYYGERGIVYEVDANKYPTAILLDVMKVIENEHKN